MEEEPGAAIQTARRNMSWWKGVLMWAAVPFVLDLLSGNTAGNVKDTCCLLFCQQSPQNQYCVYHAA